ncbi:MAG TPA: phosphoglycerate dehydrogenase [Thermoplasmatales archaeon]|nr:phosphoglycerate dehydrogenase [Thermoplasmatales archaeon]
MKILVTDKIADEAIELLKKEGMDVTFKEMEHDELLENIRRYDALIVRSRTKVTSDIIENAENLKVIGRAGIGVDNIDIETASQHGIKVVNAPTGATISVAELAIAHMLSLSRHLTIADSTMKQGRWEKKKLKGVELHGKTLGLVGCGNIGRKTAELAKAFNMKIIGYDPFLSKEDLEKYGIEKIDELKDLMSKADYISLHLPHTRETHHLINAEMLENMKPTAYIINCARGGIIDEDALYDVLKDKKIAGAALDVFEKEPPVDNPLFSLENLVATPHLGASTIEGQIRAGTVCAEQVIKTLKGETPDYWVNRKLMEK